MNIGQPYRAVVLGELLQGADTSGPLLLLRTQSPRAIMYETHASLRFAYVSYARFEHLSEF